MLVHPEGVDNESIAAPTQEAENPSPSNAKNADYPDTVAQEIPSIDEGATRAVSAVSTVALGSKDLLHATRKRLAHVWHDAVTWLQSGLHWANRPHRRSLRIITVSILLLALLGSLMGTALTAYADYNYVRGLATEGLAALTRVPADLGISTKSTHQAITDDQKAKAYSDVLLARNDFHILYTKLSNPDIFISNANNISSLKAKLQSAYLLSGIAVDGAEILYQMFDGIVAIANTIQTSPLLGNTTIPITASGGITRTDLQGIQSGIQNALPYVNDLILRLQQSDPNVLFAALSQHQRDRITPFLTLVPKIPDFLPNVDKFLTVAPQLLGIDQSSAYLIMTMDSAEVRATGGFQGNYAIVGVNGGRVDNTSLQDIYLLDKPFNQTDIGSTITAPSEYSWFPYSPWGLRDANLSADFPTSANLDLQMLHLENGDVLPLTDTNGKVIGSVPTHMAGVIAIQPEIIKQALQVTGPVDIGAPYNVTVTADNLEDKIHYYQLTNAGRAIGNDVQSSQQLSSKNKRFTALVAAALEKKAKSLSSDTLIQLAQTFLGDFQSKNIQIFLTDPQAESYLRSYQATSQMYTGSGDSLLLVNANVSGNKGSQYFSQNVTDKVQLDSRGGATHTMTIDYIWNPPPILDGTNADEVYSVLYDANADANFGLYYRQYTRVYTAPHPQVLEASGWQNGGIESTVSDFPGRGMLGAHYILRGDASMHPVTWEVPSVTLTWYVPHVYTPGQPYHLTMERQSGVNTNLSVTVIPPPCASHSLPVVSSGALTVNRNISLTAVCP